MTGTLYKHIPPDTPLWYLQGLIQCGDLTVIVGPEGVGKDQLGAALVSLTSQGKALPDGQEAEAPGGSILITPEDHPNYTTSPRLIANEANTDRILDLTFVDRGRGPEIFGIAQDIDRLRAEIEAMPECRLVWISPLNYTAGCSIRVDDTVRRRIIGPLQLLARETGVAIVLVHHRVASGKVAGSVAITQAPRCVLTIDRDPNNPAVRVISIEKTNVVVDAPGIRYTIEGESPFSRVVFLETPPSAQTGFDEPLERGKRPRPGSGFHRVLTELESDEAEAFYDGVSRIWLHKKTGLPADTVGVYLGRLVREGFARTGGMRGLYKAVVTVTPSDQAEAENVTVTNDGTYRWSAR